MLKSLRSQVFAFLSILILISVFGVGVSFWLTQRVNARLSEVNLRTVPMQRELSQLSFDTDLLKRELDRSLGFAHWNDPRWKPRRIPVWTFQVHRSTMDRIKKDDLNSQLWRDWHSRLSRLNSELGTLAESLFVELQDRHMDKASELYPEWLKKVDMLHKEVEWAKREIDTETRAAFRDAQDHVQNLRIALKLLLLVVIGVALVMVWMGERALRPIGHLRQVIQQITERGSLTSKERADLPLVSLQRDDEVSELAREFYQMATTVIEREKTIEHQRARLEEQNKTLMHMGDLKTRLQQAEHLAAVGRLSAQVAHEVGNPLHSIGLESELALDLLGRIRTQDAGDLINIRHSLQSVLGSVERLQKIIQNYLKLSRLTPGTSRPIDFVTIIETVLATYSNSLQQYKIKVNWNFDEKYQTDGLASHGDPELIEYALGNLIRNSIQALEKISEKEREIQLHLKVLDSKAYLTIEDTGTGVAEELRAHLFKPFFTTKAQGTGLGLSFVKKVFNDLGGDFYLKSRESKGAAFEGYIPMKRINSMVSSEVTT